ncbi:hypothetical protein DPX16_7453 [Anabarilius grahami]|uniref:Uncharacterized protein n=1 Tax=Anabarilius grahami TaxID=495550 RepID=A0A3N0YKD2_ANAGA|nr:hypothetical protein DPX16_7453 [Anabarilius grahami]
MKTFFFPSAQLQNSHSQTRPSTRLSSYVPEHTYDYEESSSEDRSKVFAELRSRRIEHKKSEDTGNHQYSDIQHKPITLSEKLTPRRPQTARAVLQRLPDRNRRNAQLE